VLVRQVKEALRVGKTKAKWFIVLGCRVMPAAELAREFVVVEFTLPGKQELGLFWKHRRLGRQKARGECPGTANRCRQRSYLHRSGKRFALSSG